MRIFARRPVLVAVVGVLGLLARPSAADEVTPGDPVSAREGEPFADSVDPRTGAMTYGYAFQLPAARGLSGPGLALQYNSSTRDREAGFGWGLDLPAIELRPLAGLAQFTAQGEPLPLGHARYVFQGQSLVKICTVGAGCPEEPSTQGHPAWAGGWTYYRVQTEGLFARFYQSSDRATWRCVFKGGEVVDFGAPSGESYGMPAAVETKGPGIVRWHPVVRRDLEHPNNVAVYRWQHFGNNGLLYLTDIFDTPSLGAPTSLASFAHHTQLKWDNMPFLAANHQSPERAPFDMRLNRVAVASMPWSGTGPREVYRIYGLEYFAQRTGATYDPATQGPLWHHSFLKRITDQGHCRGLFESGDGSLPASAQCSSQLPDTSFAYEPGPSTGFIANLPTIEAGPPNAVQDYKVLPYPESAGIVDFNRDGLPDLVQSWEGPRCAIGFSRKMAILKDDPTAEAKVVCLRATDTDDQPYGVPSETIRSARPILGYINQGTAGLAGSSYQFQCMDAGSETDATGLLFHNVGVVPPIFNAPPYIDNWRYLPKFLNANSNTILGGFGSALGVWGGNDFVTFFARSIAQPGFAEGQAPPNFALGGCHLDAQFNSGSFFPRWQWQTQNVSAWTYPALRTARASDGAEWFVDVDGDGYADALRPVIGQPSPLELHGARVAFTKRFGTGEAVPTLPTPNTAPGPGLVPFVDDPSAPINSLSPIEGKHGALSGTWDSAPNGRKTQVFYADMNGDGLPDLVTSNILDSGGNLRIRPGDGTGRFSCNAATPSSTGDPWTCVTDTTDPNTKFYEASFSSIKKPWWSDVHSAPWGAFYIHDVTGDGLADVIRYNATAPLGGGGVEVWVNLDGRTFACVGPGGSCTAATAYDVGHATYVTNARVAFADMNADGIDDIVLLARQGAFRASVFVPTFDSAVARGTRPGQLTHIRTGYGSTTRVHYNTIQELDVAARTSGSPWQHHSPVVEAVVTKLITEDTATANGSASPPAPYDFRRGVEYTYRDPAYDAWQRRFVGFRKVMSRMGDEAARTETTYWFGPCENAAPPSRDANGQDVANFCPLGSDDEFTDHPTFRSWVGKPVRVDRFIPAQQGNARSYLWSRYFEYEQPVTLLSPAGDRHVTFTYPKKTETHVYRPEQGASLDTSFVPLAGGDPIEHAPVQTGSKVVEVTSIVDSNGTLVQERDTGDGAEADTPRVTQVSDVPFGSSPAVTCDATWRCLPTYLTTAEDASGQLTARRQTRLTYAADTRDLTDVEGYLDDGHYLYRTHEDSGTHPYSPGPSSMAGAGWKALGHYEYSADGVVTLALGPGDAVTAPRSCTRFVPDDAYGQFSKTILNYKDGCAGAALETNLAFDRGFGSVTSTTAPDLGISMVTYDAFGRPLDTYVSRPDQAAGAMAQTAHFTYRDLSPVSSVDVQRFTGFNASTGVGTNPVRSVQLLNGLLESVLRLDQGDGGTWIANGWAQRDRTGRTYLTRRPFSAGAINPVVAGGPTLAGPGSAYIYFAVDGFGRQFAVSENGAPVLERRFDLFTTEVRDAEQLVGGHQGAFSSVEMNTRGQVRRTKAHSAAGEDIVTDTQYDVTGKPQVIARNSSTGGAYQRHNWWDSLGRIRGIFEPNTTGSPTTYSWVYAWDDANRLVGTNDARGCGKDVYYDSLGRVVGEDYSPCLSSQAEYTPADPSTGLGFEVRNRYDDYEPGQVQPDGTFADAAVLATGRLTASEDRGSHTRYNYDNRGRARAVSRQVSKPLSQLTPGAIEYAPHWYKTRSDFDHADRPTRRTSGADEGPFALGGGTGETYTYSSRGLLQSVLSLQHGAIVSNRTYELDGQLTQVTYGDPAATKGTFTYDAKRRLDTYKVNRATPPSSLWSTPTANYTIPTPDTKQLNLADFKYHYDLVGNPKKIEDKAPSADWPAYASPQFAREMTYDDLYRVHQVDYSYGALGGAGSYRSPFRPEIAMGDRRPAPLQTQHSTRVQHEQFDYDFLGNTTETTDDLAAFYDRSLGNITNGNAAGLGPSQLTAAQGIEAKYDAAGNLEQLKVTRAGDCDNGFSGSMCAQWYAYDWNEVGELARARRWDYASALPTTPDGKPPTTAPEWDLNYAYSGGSRVLKSAKDGTGVERHTLEIFATLRLEHDEFLVGAGDYERHRGQTHAYLAGGAGHVFYDGGTLPAPTTTKPTRLFLNIGDHLGSSTITIDHTSSEVVERATFAAHGAIESDYRPSRWGSSREPYKFTGKEEDIEVGATYFGARYYNARLGRFMSPDPLTIHGMSGDLNPYAYVRGMLFGHIDAVGLSDETVNAAMAPEAPPAQSASPSMDSSGASPSPDDIPWVMGPKVPLIHSMMMEDRARNRASNEEEYILDGLFGHAPTAFIGPPEPSPYPMPDNYAPGPLMNFKWTCQGSCPAKPWDHSKMEVLEAGVSPAPRLLGRVIEEAVANKTVGELRKMGAKDAHHIIQDAAVRELEGYRSGDAPGIRLNGPSSEAGTEHNLATEVQRQAGGGTYGAERRIGYKALRKAGIGALEAREEIGRADLFFEGIGVNPSTRTRIPGNRW